uniref:TIR domain-containing protein n=1 Tax=Fagus sylvatica TaxID=28930 RepID=A0A2N9HDS9_FAGSY
MSTQKASSSSTPSWKYDVFLSFRGEDTRNSFTDHLYTALKYKGIDTFKDEEKLKRGKSIQPELLKAIEESRFAIVILSRNYASSTWCLNELEKIIRCMKEMKMRVLPIFYDVDPSNVRKQTGTFAQAFAKHEEHFKDNIEKVQTWRIALREVANLKGWHLQDRPESKIIQNIVGELWHNLNYAFLEDLEGLVGIISQVEKLKSCLAIGSNDIRIIGVWGMGGIGSRVIITTRDKHLLQILEVDKIYDVEGLNDDKALHLLSLKAFKKDHPPKDYLELSKDVVHYAKGLPLAIEILGSFLSHRSIDEWKKCPEELGKRSRLWLFEDINDVLTENTGTKEIQGIVLNMLTPKEAHWNPESFSKMQHLKLLIIDNVYLLHDPKHLPNGLRILDWSGYPSKSFPPSFQPKSFERLKSIRLTKSLKLIETPSFTETPVLEKIGCKNLKSLPNKFEMESLEILTLSGCAKVKKIPEFGGNMERVCKLYLDGTAITKLPMSIEHLSGLASLNLRNCKNLVCLPDTIFNLKLLKDVVISGCSKLGRLPENLGNAKSVLKLYLDGTAITKLPTSIEHLTGLTSLNLRDCKNLVCLPNTIFNLKLLKDVDISGCSKLKRLPENLGNAESVVELDVSGTAIRHVPSSIGLLKNLKRLSFRGCKGLSSSNKSWYELLPFYSMPRSPDPMDLLSSSLSGLCSLTKLDLRECNLKAIPNDFGCLFSLKDLFLNGNDFVCLPESIGGLSNLSRMWLDNCTSLQSLPKLPLNIWEIGARGCISLQMLPDQLKVAQHLYLDNCSKLTVNQGFIDMYIAMISKYLQGLLSSQDIDYINIVIPGSEIPEWCSHQILEVKKCGLRMRSGDDYDGAGPSGEGCSNDVHTQKRIERLIEFMSLDKTDCEESSEYKECGEELSDWQESSESDLEVTKNLQAKLNELEEWEKAPGGSEGEDHIYGLKKEITELLLREEDQGIADVALRYFQDIFSTSTPSTGTISEVLEQVPRKVSVEINRILGRSEEVHMIGDSVTTAMLECLNKGALVKAFNHTHVVLIPKKKSRGYLLSVCITWSISLFPKLWLIDSSVVAGWINSKNFYPIPKLPVEAKVEELMDKENGGWKMQLVRRCFMPADFLAITSIPLNPKMPEDVLFWWSTPSGKFLVKSAYHMAMNMKRSVDGSESSNSSDLIRTIWKEETFARLEDVLSVRMGDYAAAQVQFGSPSKEVPRREIRWKPPEGGWVKENMDGAVFHDIQKVGLGVVIRTDLGEFLGACCELLNVSGFRITGSFACY